ncbi:MAG: 23S rRNA (pseudouridine(1915)-N(3))-methyltransferase RlmH [Lachnospiraceae bacterium]|nr:23S rRNA (pseudouridine(1915)-N(3))-methyltransferase RlmH [Lachnospiraceae bacterium]
MLKVDIICVGKLKEKYLRDAQSEYEKRLSKYCRLSILEVADEKTVEGAGEAQLQRIKETEAERLLKHVRDDAFLITLEIEGEQKSSEELSDYLYRLGIKGISHVQFIIGGSLGLPELITKKAGLHLSFSRLTFPHQLMRVILLEQIYRCFKISANEPYHK